MSTAAGTERTVDGSRPWLRAVVGGASVWAASRAVVTAIALLARWIETGSALGGTSPALLLHQWDSGWFRTIVENGYFAPGAIGAPAFFPGYPLAARAVAWLFSPFTSDPVPWAMTVVAALGALAACIVLWRLADHQGGGPRSATAAVVLFAFGPYAVFLHASYSESLFLAAAIAAWYFGTTGRWWWAGALAAAAGFTRANGLFVVAALFVMYLVQARRDGRRILRPDLLGVALGGAGTAAYFGWLWLQTGHIDAWLRAQRDGWDRASLLPWDALRATVHAMLTPSGTQAQPQFLLDIVFGALLVVVAVWLARRRDWPALTLVVLTAASLMTSNSWLSLARNTTTLFPIPLTVGRGADREGWRFWVFVAVLIASGALLWFNTTQFALGRWAD